MTQQPWDQQPQQQAPWDRSGYGQQAPNPPQGQPWQEPGYGQPYQGQPQPQYAPQPQYPQGPFQPPRRKRHIVRNVLAGIGGVIVVIIAISVAANSGSHTIQTMGSTPGGSGTAKGTGGSGKAGGSTKTAGIGSAITLSGFNSGEQMAVTVTKVITTAKPADEFTSAPKGDRLYAVQFRLNDTGNSAYSDSPSNGAEVTDSSGQSYNSALADTVTGCPLFPASENIAAGSSGLGCIVFEVPKSAKITEVQFTLDSGMGPQTGQWNVG